MAQKEKSAPDIFTEASKKEFTIKTLLTYRVLKEVGII